jgi:hypothetical protein
MIERAVAARVPFSWVAGDEVYGGNPKLRGWLEEQEIPYVMAVACSEIISTAAGGMRADELAARIPPGGWQRLSCADGSKGPRLYDWALIGTDSPRHHLLVRRSLAPGEKGTLELAFFRCWSPRPVTLPELTAVAGARWGIEDCFGEAKNEAGLNHYQVRKYCACIGTPSCPCSPTHSSPSPPALRALALSRPRAQARSATKSAPPLKGDLTPVDRRSLPAGIHPASFHNGP